MINLIILRNLTVCMFAGLLTYVVASLNEYKNICFDYVDLFHVCFCWSSLKYLVFSEKTR